MSSSTHVTKDMIMKAAQDRRERIKGYMTSEPPLPLKRMMEMEGMTHRSIYMIIKELEAETGVKFFGQKLRVPKDEMPYGLTNRTLRLRQKLGDHLYLLLERGSESSKIGRHSAAPRIGINNREQIRAEQRPFNHDWKLSQIERLARELNRDPQEFLLSCLTG